VFDEFSPDQIKQFSFQGHEYDADARTVTLRYGFDDGTEFHEKIVFNEGRNNLSGEELEALHRCLRLLHLVVGVSYYKAAVPPEMGFSRSLPSKAVAGLVKEIYHHGLGEFAFLNDLDLTDRLEVPAADEEPLPPNHLTLNNKVVVPLGGGKDSLVSVELLRKQGIEFSTISIGKAPLIQQVSAAIGIPHIRIDRTLSHNLIKLNRLGAYNGHVPISAILACIMLAGSILYEYDTVVMSNERSASSANVILDNGFEVNHQYSKSAGFERAFQSLVEAEILPGFKYFSLLRPYSELAITAEFSKYEQYHRVFSSCNRNFRLSGPNDQRWCRKCPKCRFVFLALAPFMEPDRLTEIFGGNLLDDSHQLEGYEELLGLKKFKPFECVGEIGESRAAMRHLVDDPKWSNNCVVSTLGGMIAFLPSEGELLADWMQRAEEYQVPEPFSAAIDALGQT
jgi:hypothetical protein